MTLHLRYSRATAAVYEAPAGSALPHLAVVLLDGEVLVARAVNERDAAARYASEARKVLQALELSDPTLVIDQEI